MLPKMEKNKKKCNHLLIISYNAYICAFKAVLSFVL